jgi:hypothetical protein
MIDAAARLEAAGKLHVQSDAAIGLFSNEAVGKLRAVTILPGYDLSRN